MIAVSSTCSKVCKNRARSATRSRLSRLALVLSWRSCRKLSAMAVAPSRRQTLESVVRVVVARALRASQTARERHRRWRSASGASSERKRKQLGLAPVTKSRVRGECCVIMATAAPGTGCASEPGLRSRRRRGHTPG